MHREEDLGAPKIVDRRSFQAEEIDELRLREKQHMKEK